MKDVRMYLSLPVKTFLAIAVSLSAVAAGMGPAQAAAVEYKSSGANQKNIALGHVGVSFYDKWTTPATASWKFKEMWSNTRYETTKQGPHAYTWKLTLQDTICASKYGIGDISFSGPPGVSQEGNCFSVETDGDANDRQIIHDLDGAVARGNSYGRWLWVSHTSGASMKYGATKAFTEAYRKSTPVGTALS